MGYDEKKNENEKRKNEKKNSDTQNRNSENKERMQHNYDANSSTDVAFHLSIQMFGCGSQLFKNLNWQNIYVRNKKADSFELGYFNNLASICNYARLLGWRG